MSKYITILVLIFLISGCGFKSVYNSDNDLNSANIEVPKTKLGYILKNELKNILQLPKNHKIKINQASYEKKAMVYNQQREKLRYNIITSADYTVFKNSKEIRTKQEKVTTSYNVTQSDYSNLIAEEKAAERGAKEIAEKIAKNVIID